MTLHQLTEELERIDSEIQKLRRADYEIPGDAAFSSALRQHVVLILGELRETIDALVMSLDHVEDVDKLTTMMTVKQRLMAKVRKALGPGKDEDAG